MGDGLHNIYTGLISLRGAMKCVIIGVIVRQLQEDPGCGVLLEIGLSSKGMAMNVNGLRLVAVLVLVAGLTGCNNNHKKAIAQNKILKRQNISHMQQLNEAQLANRRLQDQLAGTGATAEEIAALKAQLAASNSRTIRTNTGFEGIEGIEAERTTRGISVRIPGDVLFTAGKVDIKKSAQRSLDKIAKTISSKYPGQLISIEGFTDSDPIRKSKWKDNWNLSAQRSIAVLRYLNKKGVKSNKLQSVAHGKNQSRGV